MSALLNLLVACSLLLNVVSTAEVTAEDGFPYWGSANSTNDTSIKPFTVTFTDEEIADLKERLNDTREMNPPMDDAAFTYGFNTNILFTWLQYWQNNYNFTERLEYFNSVSHFKTVIQGLNIHFIRATSETTSSDAKVLPLLFLHGWPGTVRELYEAIKLLVNIKVDGYVLDIIAPSLPGFGFSEAPVRPGCGSPEMAVILRNLMIRLGFDKYLVIGGDCGAIIGQDIATLYPKEVQGYYTNFAIARSLPAIAIWVAAAFDTSLVVEPALEDRLYPVLNVTLDLMREIGYLHLQSTKPDSLSVAMSDSPAGLLAYILQTISSQTRKSNVNKNDGGLDDFYTRDTLLDIVSINWFTNSFTTSCRFYAETISTTSNTTLAALPTPVATRVIQAKDEMFYMTRRMLKFKFPNLLNATVLDDGGHFLAMEKPKVLVDDIQDAINDIIAWNQKN